MRKPRSAWERFAGFAAARTKRGIRGKYNRLAMEALSTSECDRRVRHADAMRATVKRARRQPAFTVTGPAR